MKCADALCGDDARQRGLAAARRPPEDQRVQTLALDHVAQQTALADQVPLADELVELRGRMRSASGASAAGPLSATCVAEERRLVGSAARHGRNVAGRASNGPRAAPMSTRLHAERLDERRLAAPPNAVVWSRRATRRHRGQARPRPCRRARARAGAVAAAARRDGARRAGRRRRARLSAGLELGDDGGARRPDRRPGRRRHAAARRAATGRASGADPRRQSRRRSGSSPP